MALNVLVYVAWQFALGDPLLEYFMSANFLVSWEHLQSGLVWTLLTSEFSHVSAAHLLFNLFALWMFGRDVEQMVGARGFMHLYIAGGVIASIGHALYGAVTGDMTPALGASGAAMSILVVSALVMPRRTLLLFFIIPLPAIVAVGGFVLIDIIGLLSPGGSMVAHAAHLGGAAYGAMYYHYRFLPYLKERVQRTGFVRVS